MSNRSAKFVSALVATILAGANFTAVAENTANSNTKTADTKTADSCLSGPKGSAPAGSHWRYRVERDTKRKCWYLGDEKTAKAAPAKQDAAAPDTAATSADAAPAQAAPPQPGPAQAAPAMRQSVANARAELTQGNVAPAGNVNVAQADPAAAPANAPSSAVSTRWLDAQSMGSTNGARLAATQPTASAPADEAAPAPEPAAAPAPPAPASVAAERSSGSTQMLLIVMVGALALAGLVGALVFKLTRTRTPPYQIRDEWRAPWDSIHTERAPTLMPREAMQMRLSEAPPRRAEPPIARQRGMREPEPDNAEATQQINAMLQRLARSAAT
jgi:hypothetical protein